jgi:alpha-L-rhamnosidase
VGASARGTGTGVTLSSALGAAHAAGAATTIAPGPTYVLDFGKQLSGLPKISASGPAGSTVTLIPAETVNADGSLNLGSTGGSATSQILYRYTRAGSGTETWHAQFTYNGFRYLQVTGLAAAPTQDNVTVLVTHASNRETATFDSSSDLLDQIYAISKQALENNMQSVLTDCPDREKGPYTGDNLHNIDTELTLFDMQSYEGQLVNNMRTAQRPVPANGQFPGMIANIAPEYHFVPPSAGGTWFLDEPNWGGAVIMIPWNLYVVYGDTAAMRVNYDAMVKWLDWEATTKAANNGNIRGLGDWSAAQSTTAQAVIDYGYYRGANTMAKIAALLGKAADADKYAQLATSLAAEYNTKYLHTDDQGHAWYANNTEASNAVALDAGLVPDQYRDAVVNSLVAAVHAYGDRIGTGSVALGPLFRTLHAAGRDDVIYTMVANPASPGYAFLVNSGKTTLTESLSGTGSQDHHFLGEVASWFVHGLVGIQQAPGSIGYRSLEIKPALVGDLNHAEGTYTTPQGDAAASWTRAANGLLSSLAVTVPGNTTARVYVPTSSPTETFVASGGATVTYVGYQNGAQVYDVADGSTTFVHGTSSDTTVGGTVPATLSLTLGPAASFGAFTPGVAKEYTASTTANVISTAGDAALSVSDPGHLTNGSFSLPEALRVEIAPASWTGPVSNASAAITFRQHIGAGDALRTGSYSKTLTFTLSTTTP